MKIIYKYRLDVIEKQVLKLPRGAQLLCVKNQREQLCVWAVVDTIAVGLPAEYEEHTFLLYGTGYAHEELPPSGYQYLGTIQMQAGVLVFHIFIN
jgi:hypothetical protein